MPICLVAAESQDHWRQARQFVEEYAASLNVDLSFQDFKYEVENLETGYAGPLGSFYWLRGQRLFGLHSTTAVQRRYRRDQASDVAPAGRGHGVGRCLVEGVVAKARQIGYTRLVIDTLPSMKEAQKL